MNLCLSGLARRYAKVNYPAGVGEAIARIGAARPDAVTVNEACGGDIALIARRTGYHARLPARAGVQVCTAHVASRQPVEAAANRPQCQELTALLARRATAGSLIFGGDVNRVGSCAPRGAWTRADRSGDEDPGSQQVYGTGALRSPVARVEPAAHTDHGFLLVRSELAALR